MQVTYARKFVLGIPPTSDLLRLCFVHVGFYQAGVLLFRKQAAAHERQRIQQWSNEVDQKEKEISVMANANDLLKNKS